MRLHRGTLDGDARASLLSLRLCFRILLRLNVHFLFPLALFPWFPSACVTDDDPPGVAGRAYAVAVRNVAYAHLALPPARHCADTRNVVRDVIQTKSCALKHDMHASPLAVSRGYARRRELHFPGHDRGELDVVRVLREHLAPFLFSRLCEAKAQLRVVVMSVGGRCQKERWVWGWRSGRGERRH